MTVETTLPAAGRTGAAPTRTVAQVRQKALEHFDRIAAMPCFLDWDAADCQRYARYGMLLVDQALQLADGQELPVAAFCKEHALDENGQIMTLQALNVCMGHLDLLRLEFFHATAGTLPLDVVRALEGTKAPWKAPRRPIRTRASN